MELHDDEILHFYFLDLRMMQSLDSTCVNLLVDIDSVVSCSCYEEISLEISSFH